MRLVSDAEHELWTELDGVALPRGLKVAVKVRFKDAVPMENAALSSDDYSYGLKAHLDFVVTDPLGEILFAVELDEPRHIQDPAVIARDNRKNRLCQTLGLPLLRIGSRVLLHAETESHRLVRWAIEMWLENRELCNMQARGELPDDEDFDPQHVIDLGPDGTLRFPNNPFHPLQRAIDKLHASGVVARRRASFLHGRIPDRHLEVALATNFTPDGRWLVGEGFCRSWGLGYALDTDIAAVLALQDLVNVATGRVQRDPIGHAAFVERYSGWLPDYELTATDSSVKLTFRACRQPEDG